MKELEQHCQRWVDKSKKYDEEKTEEVFDKFFTLFVAYNSIYFNATMDLIKNGKIGKRRTGDKVSATKNMTDFIGTEKLYNTLIDLKVEVLKIIEEIEDKRFFVSTKEDNYTADHEEDTRLISEIKDNFELKNKAGKRKFNIALLTLIYGVRCNMFHGQKRISSPQKKILNPMNKILETIINNSIIEGKLRF